MANQIAFVYGDNWEGMFINDRLVLEDHRIESEKAAKRMLYQVFDDVELLYVDQEWLDNAGSFPDNLNDVLLENGKTVRETRG